MEQYFAWFGLPGSFVLTSLLSLTAIVLALVFKERDRRIAAVAMVICSFGDLVLANFMDLQRFLPIPNFYVGAGFFIIGHLVYMYAFITLIRKRDYQLVTKGFWGGGIFTVVVFAVVTVAMVTGNSFPGVAMYAICLLYACIIGANLSIIWSFAWSERALRSIVALGALLFFISDLFIGLGRLCGMNQFDHLIWWFYPIGQFLLILCA